MTEKMIKEIAQNVAKAVAEGNGFAVSRVDSTFREDSENYEEIKTVLNRKWHINVMDIEDDFVVFIIDSYGENHINRIVKKAQNFIDENKAIIDAIDVLIKNENLIRFFV